MTRRSLADVDVRDGGHVWLVADLATQPVSPAPPAVPPVACALVLPGSWSIDLPPHALPITRTWLLEHLSPLRRQIEQLRFLIRRSPYQAVSASAPHCTLLPLPDGRWAIETARTDVETSLNEAALPPHRRQPLLSSDRIQPGGARGPTLTVVIGFGDAVAAHVHGC